MFILKAESIRFLDQFTIQHEPITSIDLMERAAGACVDWMIEQLPPKPVTIYCGTGNNGGDGLAIARLLAQKGWTVSAILLQSRDRLSSDHQINLQRLQQDYPSQLVIIRPGQEVPRPADGYVVDAIFGTGFSGEASGLELVAIEVMNDCKYPIISIDLPSGLASNKSSIHIQNKIVKAKNTLTFQYLKPCLVMPENIPFFGTVSVLDIGLDPRGLEQIDTSMELVTPKVVKQLMKERLGAGHKGDFGHALIMAGGSGKSGAGILAAKSCLRSGCGLLSMVIPSSENVIFQAAIPEAMTLQYDATNSLSTIPIKTSAVAAGPGIGTDVTAMQTLTRLMELWPQPLVVDADAINLLSQHHELLQQLPEGSLLTPHVGEFERFAGKKDNDFDRLDAQLERSKVLGIYILLKGAFTKITTPGGKIWVNPTGNAGMAKGGSGDILTGLIAGLAARGYSLEEAAILGAYLHGLAGDLCAERLGMEAMHAGDLIEMIPEAWKRIQATTFN